jgi:ribosomal protein S12 methylthiotransferase accessory factor
MEIHVTFPGGRQVDAMIGQFIVRTDQPHAEGGLNTAPTPFDLFLVSLATCAGFYVVRFCQARQIPTDEIRLIQRSETDPKGGALQRVSVEIHVPKSFPAQYLDAVARAAASCKVKKTLEHPPRFEITTLVDQPRAA